MPVLDLLLPVLIVFIVLFYVLILVYVFYLWRSEKRVEAHLTVVEKQLVERFDIQTELTAQKVIKVIEQLGSQSSMQLQQAIQGYQDSLLNSAKIGGDIEKSVIAQFGSELGSVKQQAEYELKQAMQVEVKDLYAAHKQNLDSLTKEYLLGLQEYKKQLAKQSEQAAREYSLRILNEVMTVSLRDDDHEKLFDNALQRAKGEGLFNGEFNRNDV